MLIFLSFQIKALPQASSIDIIAHLQFPEDNLATITSSVRMYLSKEETNHLKGNQI